MLFVFREGHLAAAWPVTVGRPDWRTPLGSYPIAALELNPTWHVSPAIRAEMEDEEIPSSAEVKPGLLIPLANAGSDSITEASASTAPITRILSSTSARTAVYGLHPKR
jgi:hypothetical protein